MSGALRSPFDVVKKVVKYRSTEADAWNAYVPLQAESARAEAFFRAK